MRPGRRICVSGPTLTERTLTNALSRTRTPSRGLNRNACLREYPEMPEAPAAPRRALVASTFVFRTRCANDRHGTGGAISAACGAHTQGRRRELSRAQCKQTNRQTHKRAAMV